ncbi:hypothetical protein CK203_086672 [Vitis vinifera]|uniref:DUF7894 domain-containing protein n=1 Tax=Vitis vinifera TaxID=29760 RepID=A0A438EES7_VITVI|nr:hypothetical protein CK203_086672 [Vitis vinifera]
MKVAPKIVFLFNDCQPFFDALRPNPNSSLTTLEDAFHLSLERYGIEIAMPLAPFFTLSMIRALIRKVGLVMRLSMVLLQNYEPPILACAVNEVLASITGEQSSPLPTFLVPSSKLKWEIKNSAPNHKNALYGMQIGPETETTQALATRTKKPPSLLQIHHEPLAIFIQLARVLKLPTFVLIGQNGKGEELEAVGDGPRIAKMLHKVGEVLASTSGLCFLRERIKWNPTMTSKDVGEPWRALYG